MLKTILAKNLRVPLEYGGSVRAISISRKPKEQYNYSINDIDPVSKVKDQGEQVTVVAYKEIADQLNTSMRHQGTAHNINLL